MINCHDNHSWLMTGMRLCRHKSRRVALSAAVLNYQACQCLCFW